MKTTNAVRVATKHLQKAAKKHMMGHQKQPSLDLSIQSSDDGRSQHFRRDVDSFSQDSSNGTMPPPGPAAKASLHKGAMSEPLRRAYRALIQDSPVTKKGILTRMSSTVSNSGATVPCMRVDSPELESSFQSSCPGSPDPESRTSFQGYWAESENQQQSPNSNWSGPQSPVKTFEPAWPKPPASEDFVGGPEPDNILEPQLVSEPLSQTEPLSPQPQPLAQPLPKPEYILSSLVPPPSPARVRRTIETPANPCPSSPLWANIRSRSCPRKQITSPHTPMVNCKPAVRWQTPPEQNCGTYSKQVRPVLNGLCLSDSTSSSDASIDSLELQSSCVPSGEEQREGTLQREMNALFNQKMREIRCKSPLFFQW